MKMGLHIDTEKLRSDLEDYYGTAAMIMPLAMADVAEVERASDDKLLKMAQDARLDLGKYVKEDK